MKYSYDYSGLIMEIQGDIEEGLISPSSLLKIVRRKTPVYLHYYPIIDYYYEDNYPEEIHEVMTVKDALREMKEGNRIM